MLQAKIQISPSEPDEMFLLSSCAMLGSLHCQSIFYLENPKQIFQEKKNRNADQKDLIKSVWRETMEQK